MSSKNRNTSKQRRKCDEISVGGDKKKLFLFSVMSFLLALFSARFFYALQSAGIVTSSPNVFGGFHFHHWAIATIVLAILIPLMYSNRNKPRAFGILVVISFFFIGLFLDGIIYADSSDFFLS